jgi:hypothetical protein
MKRPLFLLYISGLWRFIHLQTRQLQMGQTWSVLFRPVLFHHDLLSARPWVRPLAGTGIGTVLVPVLGSPGPPPLGLRALHQHPGCFNFNFNIFAWAYGSAADTLAGTGISVLVPTGNRTTAAGLMSSSPAPWLLQFQFQYLRHLLCA